MRLVELKVDMDKNHPSMVFMGTEIHDLTVPRIKSGVFIFDLLTGGGIPEGRFSIFKGVKSSGKTTMATRYIGQYQTLYPDRSVVFADFEHTYDASWARHFGIDDDRLMVIRPDYGEQGVDLTVQAAEMEDVGLIIVDSLASIIPTVMSEADAGDDHVGNHAKLINKLLRKLVPVVSRSRRNNKLLTILLINQVRSHIGMMRFGPQTSDPGGFYKDHISSMDVKFYGGKYKKSKSKVSGESIISSTHLFTVDKNKVGPPKLSGEFTIYLKNHNGHTIGSIDEVKDIVEYARRANVLCKNTTGTGWTLSGTDYTVGSLAGLIEDLNTDKEFLNELKTITLTALLLQSKDTSASPEAEEIEDRL